ncbi:alpha/beta hydrolase [Marinobacter salinisoli]|uniref:Alpha/beta hydrolase n=1 Tax=Marinobacter salinisoli TaxID=2769486 RepID=A0ABX7MPU6_9GAMM|nr:alpha/beta hydrolase [Marinobacter salinisoli]QSP94318.1 alpha/beta hydrolase [Marinobacter salinisoli]
MKIHLGNLSEFAHGSVRHPPKLKDIQHDALAFGLEFYAKVSTDGAQRLIEKMAFTPHRPTLPIPFEDLLDDADSHTQLHYGNNILPVYCWGDGPTIVGVHGWSGSGIQFGAYVEPLVEAGYRVALYDAPAHGRAQGSHTDLCEMTEVLTKVGHHLGSVYGIIAHSTGCIAAGRALVDGLEADRVAMLAPPATYSDVVDQFGAELGLSDTALASHRQHLEERLGEDVWNRLALHDLASDLEQPGLVVVAEDDQTVPASHSHLVHRNWTESQLLKTQGLGHNDLIGHPDVVQAVTRHMTGQ